MTLTFDIGDDRRPRGHALLYFGRPETGLLATYAVLLPITLDLSKYLPPLMAAQLGGAVGEMIGANSGSFAMPPVPEPVESYEWLRRAAELRGDDLLWGGDLDPADLAAAMQRAVEAVQEYAALHKSYLDDSPAPVPAVESRPAEDGAADVQHVLYQLMGDRDRLAELSKLVGAMRFALVSNDEALIRESDASLGALAAALDARYWADRVRAAAQDPSDAAAKLAQLYVDRCYRLLDEDYAAVEALEAEIDALTGGAPPRRDLRS